MGVAPVITMDVAKDVRSPGLVDCTTLVEAASVFMGGREAGVILAGDVPMLVLFILDRILMASLTTEDFDC